MQTLSTPVIWLINTLGWLSLAALLLTLVALLAMYLRDRTQRYHTVRRNFPVIGRLRYGLEHLGPFLRQYLYDTDRDRFPFNRAERSWVYRAAKNVDTTVAFGSTLDIQEPGTVIFANAPFPTLACDALPPQPMQIGQYCRHPYTPGSLFNISGMSYGALSRPAVQSLSRGAALAGCWLNTGEGGLSPYHLEGGCDIVMQIGTAKYGVRNQYAELDYEKIKEVAAHEQVRMFEIKLS